MSRSGAWAIIASMLAALTLACAALDQGQGTPTNSLDSPIANFSLQGSAVAAASSDRCDPAVQGEMASLIHQVGEGEVAVRRARWDSMATSGRVGFASWLSECTQQGRAVILLGDHSGKALARYDPSDGYREISDDR